MADTLPRGLPTMSTHADGAGVPGAVLAAPRCAGTPVVVRAVTAIGLGFLRDDAILWPLTLASLAVVTAKPRRMPMQIDS